MDYGLYRLLGSLRQINTLLALVLAVPDVVGADLTIVQWLRAEILGAFFNAVFLIALCLSIVLEAITRLIDPPVITNPMLILIVGSLGLASNLAGFFVLGGHGHSHGPDEHDHLHEDQIRDAEEGHIHAHEDDTSGESAEVEAPYTEVIPEVVIAKVKSKVSPHIRFSSEGQPEDSTIRSPSRASQSSRKPRRRTNSSIRNGRFTNIDDFSIHPASFRQELIAATKPQLEGIDSGDSTASEEEAVADDDEVPTENSPLLTGPKGTTNGTLKNDDHSRPKKPRHDSWHVGHNHMKAKKPAQGGHGHSHGDMGMNAMILHVIGDALGNVGVIVSALIIWLSTSPARFYADPAVSLFITLIILKSTIPLTSATSKILLQATPDHIDVTDIKEDIQELPGILSCHHVHIWQLSDTQIVASMHIQVEFPISEAGGEKYMELAKAIRRCLHGYGIHSATIQPEFCLDKDHDHVAATSVGLDGIVGQPRCGLDDDSCLLECVDDCMGKGCCSPKSVEPQHDHSDHDGHTN